MNHLIEKIIWKEIITDEDIMSGLVDICEKEHSLGCSNECPVYKINDGIPYIRTSRDIKCRCFKNGDKMLDFIRRSVDNETEVIISPSY